MADGNEARSDELERRYKVRQVTNIQASWVETERGEEGRFTLQLILDNGVEEYILEPDGDDIQPLLKLFSISDHVTFDLERKVLDVSQPEDQVGAPAGDVPGSKLGGGHLPRTRGKETERKLTHGPPARPFPARRRPAQEPNLNPTTLDRYAPYALAALRIATALIFMAHGTQKLFGFPAPPQGGLPAAFSLYWVGGVLELVGGLLILLGLFTRPVAFVLAGEMAVAYWMFHFPRNFYPLLNGGDASILYCFVFLLLVFTGPGALSVDGARAPSGPRRAWER